MSGHIAGAWILRERVPRELRTSAPARPRRRHAAPSPGAETSVEVGLDVGVDVGVGVGVDVGVGVGVGATVRAALRAAVTRSRAGRHAPGRTTIAG